MRLDQRVLELGLADTRTRAQGLILSGAIRVNGQVVLKAGMAVSQTAEIEQVSDPLPYVSRGGLKLAHGLRSFGIDPTGWTVIDVGASTGGFTDCWLQAGAAKVYAVDVGYGQLAWKLRQDARVAVFERVNARWLNLERLNRSRPVDGVSVDASFIGLKLLIEPIRQLVRQDGLVIALIKPQFEAGRGALAKGGVVKDPAVHRSVLNTVIEDARRLGFETQGLTPSPIRGPRGNIEFLALLGQSQVGQQRSWSVDLAVDEAWRGGDL
jgi:23S rRNA (cytidine1920-2'-O)/16S rRNA (cytidine1409-2'-O)-methyltransferase